MKRYLKNKDKFWQIEVQDTIHTITCGKMGTKGKKTTKDLRLRSIAYRAADNAIEYKLEQGYIEIIDEADTPKIEGIFWDLKNSGLGKRVLVDLDDPKNIKLVLEELMKFLKKQVPIQMKDRFSANPYNICFYYGFLNDQGQFISHRLQALWDKVKFTNYDEWSEDFFFKEVCARYPQLHSHVKEWVDYANSIRFKVYRTEDDTAFSAPALALALSDPKYIKDFQKFLYTNDCNEEHQYMYIDEVLEKWENTKEVMPLLVASKSSLDCGTCHDNIEFSDYIDVDDEEQMELFIKCLLKDVRLDPTGEDNIMTVKGNHRKKRINEAIEFYIEPIFEELDIELKYDRVFKAIDMLENHEPIGFKNLQDESYELPVAEIKPTEYEYYRSGYDKIHITKDFQGAIEDYSHAIELNPTDAGYYVDRGYAFRLLNQNENAFKDWSKAIELDPEEYQANKNLAIYYQRTFIDYKKSFYHWNKAVELEAIDEDIICRGYLYELLGEQKKAAKDYKKALKNTKVDVQFEYAEVLILMAKYQAVFDHLKGLEITDKSQKAVSLFFQSVALIMLNQNEDDKYNELKTLLKRKIQFSYWPSGIEHWINNHEMEIEQKEKLEKLMKHLYSKKK